MGDDSDFSWSSNTRWVPSRLCIAVAADEPAVARVGGGSVCVDDTTPRSLRFSRCMVGVFDGRYELVGEANGHPHWSWDNGTLTGLHLYQGPPEQGLWLLRSKFDPLAKACSAYCSCIDVPLGTNVWHWMQDGEWVPQELLLEVQGSGSDGDNAAAAAAAVDQVVGNAESHWTLSEESVPPLEPGPWDVKAAQIAAAARQAVGANGTSFSTTPAGSESDGAEGQLSIVEQVAEYLTRLFDPNDPTGECQVLSAFEERACLAFTTPIEDGFTFEQEALHREFCALFVSDSFWALVDTHMRTALL